MLRYELFLDWIRAREDAGDSPDRMAAVLLGWFLDDPYDQLDFLAEYALRVANADTLAALERAAWSGLTREARGTRRFDRCAEMLRLIYRKRADAKGFLRVCDAAGELTGCDCAELGRICLEHREPHRALEWVERGYAIDGTLPQGKQTGGELPDVHRDALLQLGRHDEAIALTWNEFVRYPGAVFYEPLMLCVPPDQHAEWHARALAFAAEHADLDNHIELLIETRELERLATLIEQLPRGQLMNIPIESVESSLKLLAEPQPRSAALLQLSLAFFDLRFSADDRESETRAIKTLAETRRLLLRAGRPDEWAEIAREIRETYGSRTDFIARFERTLGGRSWE